MVEGIAILLLATATVINTVMIIKLQERVYDESN
jgi:hypothetical protein